MKFSYIQASDSSLSIRARCDALDVTEQGYHSFIQRRQQLSKHQQSDDELIPHIVAAHEMGRHNYGTPRLKVVLATHGIVVSRRRIGRLRDMAGLCVRSRRRFVRTTDSNHSLRISPNVLDRNFVAAAPNKVWVSDITYLRVAGHWLYLCTIIDCYSGAVVGRQLSNSIDETLVCDTMAMAIRNRQPERHCIFHSDRGSQYGGATFRKQLRKHGFIQSMSRRKNCWDNAVAESSFARLKVELGDSFDTDYDARIAVYEYIDIFYNLIRIHSRHSMAPIAFEQQAGFFN